MLRRAGVRALNFGVGGGLLIGGLMALYLAYTQNSLSSRLIAYGQEGKGVVIAKTSDKSIKSSTPDYYVSVRIAVANPVEASAKVPQQTWQRLRQGDAVSVLFLPDNPKVLIVGTRADAKEQLRSLLPIWVGGALALLGGMSLLGLSIYYRQRDRNTP